jgi:hypothetical protein
MNRERLQVAKFESGLEQKRRLIWCRIRQDKVLNTKPIVKLWSSGNAQYNNVLFRDR